VKEEGVRRGGGRRGVVLGLKFPKKLERPEISRLRHRLHRDARVVLHPSGALRVERRSRPLGAASPLRTQHAGQCCHTHRRHGGHPSTWFPPLAATIFALSPFRSSPYTSPLPV